MTERDHCIFSNSTMGLTFAGNYCRRCLHKDEVDDGMGPRGDSGCAIMDIEQGGPPYAEQLYYNDDMDSGCWGIRCSKFVYCNWDLPPEGQEARPVLTQEKAAEIGQLVLCEEASND